MPSLRHQSYQADACGEEDLVDRALAQLVGRDPVSALRGPYLDVQGLVVDADPPISAASQTGYVPSDLLLEEASRLAHGAALRSGNRRQRHLVDADSPLEGAELALPRNDPLGLARDLLRVDRVGVHASDRGRLGVTRPLESRVSVADLRLKPLASASVVGDGPQGSDRGSLLLHLERGPIAQLRHAAGLAAQQRRDLDLQRRDLLPPALFRRQQLLGGGNVMHAELAEDVLHARLGHAQTLFRADATLAPHRPVALAGLVYAVDVHRHRAPFPEPQRQEDRNAQQHEAQQEHRHECTDHSERH